MGQGTMAIRIRHAVVCTPLLLAALVGLLVHPAELAVTVGIAALFVGPLTAMCLYSADPLRGNAVRLGFAAAVLVALGGAVVAGLAALLGGVAVPVVLLVLLAGVTWVWRRGWPPRVRAFVSARPADLRALPTVLLVDGETVSTADLCETWQHTGRLLRDLPPTSADRGTVVEARRKLLDEFERRDPAGFHRWMQSEPDSLGDPGRYLRC